MSTIRDPEETDEVDDALAAVAAALGDLSVRAPAAVRPRALVGAGVSAAVLARPHPLGTACLAWSGAGIARVDLTDDIDDFAARVAGELGRSIEAIAAPPALVAALDELFAVGSLGDRAQLGQLAIDWRRTSPFQRQVLEAATQIDPGELRTYGSVAAQLGRPGASRAVGSALARNPVPLVVPCHRVGRADGTVGDYLFGSEAKARLLEVEREAHR